MPQHVWSERLELHDESLDGEHHLQMSLISAVAEALEQGRPATAKRLLDQLAGYSAAHFNGEQLLMETSGYEHLGEHCEEHRSILAHIDEIRGLLGGGELDLALPMSLDLLHGLGSHIAASDRRFANHAASRRN